MILCVLLPIALHVVVHHNLLPTPLRRPGHTGRSCHLSYPRPPCSPPGDPHPLDPLGDGHSGDWPSLNHWPQLWGGPGHQETLHEKQPYWKFKREGTHVFMLMSGRNHHNIIQ